jgi:hypothetical protein
VTQLTISRPVGLCIDTVRVTSAHAAMRNVWHRLTLQNLADLHGSAMRAVPTLSCTNLAPLRALPAVTSPARSPSAGNGQPGRGVAAALPSGAHLTGLSPTGR